MDIPSINPSYTIKKFNLANNLGHHLVSFTHYLYVWYHYVWYFQSFLHDISSISEEIHLFAYEHCRFAYGTSAYLHEIGF